MDNSKKGGFQNIRSYFPEGIPKRKSNHNILKKNTSFKVKVPVLSLHIVVADPIVSQAESRRTWKITKEMPLTY